MRRRVVFALLGCAAAWPITAGAQQRQLPRIGLLLMNHALSACAGGAHETAGVWEAA